MPFSLIPGRVDVACGPQHVALTPGIPPDLFPPLPCPDIASGTLHLVFPPLLQPTPRFNRWFGQIVMVLHWTGCENFPTRHKIRSTSSTGQNLWADKWVSILLVQETNGMISLELFLPWPQGLLARVLKEQYASLIYTTLLVDKVFLTIFFSYRLLVCILKWLRRKYAKVRHSSTLTSHRL